MNDIILCTNIHDYYGADLLLLNWVARLNVFSETAVTNWIYSDPIYIVYCFRGHNILEFIERLLAAVGRQSLL